MDFVIGADHAGFNYREKIIEYLESAGHTVNDVGTYSSESCDYPEYAHEVASKVASRSDLRGILVCGSGQGMVMTANRYSGVRAALCLNSDMARKTREHNNANCLVLAERVMEESEALKAVDSFIETDFDGGRHDRRIKKIDTPAVQVITHPIVRARLTELRSKSTDPSRFRSLVKNIATLMLFELSTSFPAHTTTVETPLEETDGWTFSRDVLVVPVIRAGLGMLDAATDFFPEAYVGAVGLERDEETLESNVYYQNFPEEIEDPIVIILDPMIATGGTMAKVTKMVQDAGFTSDIRALSLVAAEEGIETIRDVCPEISIYTAALDEGLNDQAYIVPGLGDAGDRIFKT